MTKELVSVLSQFQGCKDSKRLLSCRTWAVCRTEATRRGLDTDFETSEKIYDVVFQILASLQHMSTLTLDSETSLAELRLIGMLR